MGPVHLATAAETVKAHQFPEAVETLTQIPALDCAVLLARICCELGVILESSGSVAQFGQFWPHVFGAFPKIDHCTVFKKVSPLGIDPAQMYIVLELPPIGFKNRAEYLRKREDRW